MTDLIRVRAHVQGPAGASLSTLYFKSPAAADVAHCQEAAARVRAFFNAMNSSLASGTTTTFESSCDILTAETGELTGRVPVTAPTLTAGTATGDILPGRMQYLFKQSTGVFINGREVQGRSFVPGTTEGLNAAGGLVASGTVTTGSTAFGLLGVTITVAVSNVVWHRPQNGAGGLAVDVAGWSLSQHYGQMRKRRT